MSAAALRRVDHAASLAAQADSEAIAAERAAVADLDALAESIAAQVAAPVLLDQLATARARLADAWLARAAQLSSWRELVEAQRPPCCAAARPCKSELLACAAKVLRQFKGAEGGGIDVKPRVFFHQGRRLVASEDSRAERLQVHTEAGQLVAISHSGNHLAPDHARDTEELGLAPLPTLAALRIAFEVTP